AGSTSTTPSAPAEGHPSGSAPSPIPPHPASVTTPSAHGRSPAGRSVDRRSARSTSPPRTQVPSPLSDATPSPPALAQRPCPGLLRVSGLSWPSPYSGLSSFREPRFTFSSLPGH